MAKQLEVRVLLQHSVQPRKPNLVDQSITAALFGGNVDSDRKAARFTVSKEVFNKRVIRVQVCGELAHAFRAQRLEELQVAAQVAVRTVLAKAGVHIAEPIEPVRM
ncbi:hypothetical protein SDC9_94787 [bioreactor metagenome]|uniref:Uncharacterized protein n=1 Tax=bioreactor metagenome TaxID=1076179 RepID=A0A645A4E7_9ZZZZ